MRDINRIRPFLDKLATEWETYPDLRFGQLMSNIFNQCLRDPFFYEDDEMMELIKTWIDEQKK